ncbi:type VI secretion system baseplate subunit TssG [Aureimonas pseudogalii]|uniref:Type VI secretion system protein ImpH n=1 Tax=Aureimonas pseudogalii TaxID=1744844 RepID=A0A7W6MM34_9HYPH|nr:type VI secretion system baseplate subunit TssG [Aureimonas pseudogalii]MBB4000440.1 type VI secretion system protein ImpH [Aureimonas pseudogalii]
MAKSRRRPRSSLIETLERNPDGFELFQAMRLVEQIVAKERQRAGKASPDAIGRGVDPRRAALRIEASSNLSFASGEVTRVRFADGAPARLTQAVIGLTGAGGAMPHAFSEIVQTSLRERNPGLRDFLDLFNDRLAGLFYEAFAKYRPVIEAERFPLTGKATSNDAIRAVLGLVPPQLAERLALPDSVMLHHAGLLGRQSRSAHAVEKVLSNAIGQPIRIEQFVGEWLPIAAAERTRLGRPGLGGGAFSRLGRDAVVGQKSWSVQGRVRLLVGPLDHAPFESFLPGQWRQKQLGDLAAFSLGPDLSFVQRLTLKAEAVPTLRIGGAAEALGASRLGWNTWVGTSGPRQCAGVVDLASTSALNPHAKGSS